MYKKMLPVTLTGTNATPYTNVRIKIDLISGPATPELLATDSAGTTYNLARSWILGTTKWICSRGNIYKRNAY